MCFYCLTKKGVLLDLSLAGLLAWCFSDRETLTERLCPVSDDKPAQEEDWVVCQHPECPERRRASKVRLFHLPG